MNIVKIYFLQAVGLGRILCHTNSSFKDGQNYMITFRNTHLRAHKIIFNLYYFKILFASVLHVHILFVKFVT